MTKNNSPAVLIYRLPAFSAQGRALRQFLAQHNIRAITVNPDDSGKTLSTLLGLARDPEGTPIPLPGQPVLVTYGLVGPIFDRLLDFLQANCPIRLKAVATPFNLRWSFGHLAAELAREASGLG